MSDPIYGSAVVGGTASVLGGGKFENGAMTAAFGYLFSQLAHKSCVGSSSVMCRAAPSRADRERADALQSSIGPDDLLLAGVVAIRAVAGASVALYRSVSTAELEGLLSTRSFSVVGSSVEDKYFAESIGDAATWGR